MKIKVSRKRQIAHPKLMPSFFSKFAGLKAKGAPFASGDEAREALRGDGLHLFVQQ